MSLPETSQAALEFVREHGVVLVSAKGAAPCLVDMIAGETVVGSWWGHARGKLIFSVIGALNEHEDIAVCRLLDNKLTMVHRRLWPALAAARLPAARVARVVQEHSAAGKHINREIPFDQWIPPDAVAAGSTLTPAAARTALGMPE
jgi:hypothetical protein